MAKIKKTRNVATHLANKQRKKEKKRFLAAKLSKKPISKMSVEELASAVELLAMAVGIADENGIILDDII